MPNGPSAPAAPPPAPEGWSVGPPDYVGVGTAGSGAEWWHAMIRSHPGVAEVAGRPAALHFFDRFWDGSFSDDDSERYHAWFPRAEGRRTGEWTPGYLADFWTPPLLRRAAPEARVLVLLRDPVERFATLESDVRADTAVGPARARANSTFGGGLYADQLLRLWRAVAHEQVLVLQAERCLRDPRGELARTYAFLGLDPAPAETVDVGLPPAPTRSRLSTGQRAVLAAGYGSENQRLATLVPDLDLSLWSRSNTEGAA